MKVLVVLLAALAVCHAGYYHGRKAGPGPGAFHVHEHVEDGDLKTTTYISPPMPLAAGQVVFTDPATTFLTFPPGRIAIKSFIADIVDDTNSSVPLYEVYNHHWIVFRNGGVGSQNIGECNQLNYVFGIGAESRHTKTVYPEPYRFVVDGTETWTANIHALRTVNVPYVKQCIECHCGNISDPYAGGGFQCCQDGSFCPVSPGPQPPVKNYFLRYTIQYSDVTPDIIPVDIIVLDASYCQIEYNVPPCADPTGECVSQQTKSITTPMDVEVVFGAGHIHIGSINITLFNENTQQYVCIGYPTYGNGTEAGNEKGYVVKLSTCTWDQPLLIPANTTLTYTASYHSNPYRDAVMALFYLAIIQPKA